MATANLTSSSDSVFGHYVQHNGTSWEPLLSESSALFRAVVEDDVHTLEKEVAADASKVNAFFVLLYWGSRPSPDPNNPEQQQQQHSDNTTANNQVCFNNKFEIKFGLN